MKSRYLTIIDVTHNTNNLYKKLFTMIIKYKYKNQISEVYLLYEYKNGNIIFYCYEYYKCGVVSKVISSHNILLQMTLLLSNIYYL